jgi:hypothetical protein
MPSRRKKAISAPFNNVDIGNITKANPYIQRLIEDGDLRDNVRTAIDSTKSAYDRLTNGKAPAKALLEDKKLQRDLQTALDAVKEASSALSDAPKKRARKRGGFGRKLFIGALALGLALAGSEKLRTKLLDTVFGKEEEFEYTPPPVAPATPPSSPVGAT